MTRDVGRFSIKSCASEIPKHRMGQERRKMRAHRDRKPAHTTGTAVPGCAVGLIAPLTAATP